MNKAELVVFDLDGTLVDSRADIAASINFALDAVGDETRPVEEIYPLIGKPLVSMFAALLSSSLEASAEAAAEAYRAHYRDNCAVHTRPYPGVIRCLDDLAAVPLAVATTKMTFMAEELLGRLGLRERFELVQGSEGIPFKPDPAVLNIVLSHFGARAQNSWMIGDTVMDIRAARSAGMPAVAVTYGIGEVDALRAEKPDVMLDSLADLAAFLS